MPATVVTLGIDHLPRDERIALVQEIWDTIAAEPIPLKMAGITAGRTRSTNCRR